MTFEAAIAHLNTLGIEFTQDFDYGKQGGTERHSFDVPVLTSISLGFTPEEWCDLCMNDGPYYIGGCCGATSAAQDIVNHAFRFDAGVIRADDFHDLADILANHDEKESAFMFSQPPKDQAMADFVAQAKAEWREIDPWQKMAVIYAVVKPHLRQKQLRGTGKHLSPLEGAITTSYGILRSLSFDRVFSSEERNDQQRAMRALGLAKLIPAFKIVYEHITEYYEGPVEGYALISREQGDDVIAENRLGFVIHTDRSKIDEIIKITREQEKHYEERKERFKPLNERYGLRRVRVTLEKGIEFLGDLETIDG